MELCIMKIESAIKPGIRTRQYIISAQSFRFFLIVAKKDFDPCNVECYYSLRRKWSSCTFGNEFSNWM